MERGYQLLATSIGRVAVDRDLKNIQKSPGEILRTAVDPYGGEACAACYELLVLVRKANIQMIKIGQVRKWTHFGQLQPCVLHARGA